MLFSDGNSNMTCAEYYRFYGVLSNERIEYLLRKVEILELELKILQEKYDELGGDYYEALENVE